MYDATFRIPGHTMVEHRLEAPLDRFGAFDREWSLGVFASRFGGFLCAVPYSCR